jgi:YHS domain-containing protein
MRIMALLTSLAFVLSLSAADNPPSARQALKPFNVLVGSWKGTGQPEGTRRDKQAGFWTETIDWSWRFKGEDAWLNVTFDEGKYFAGGELRAVPGKDQFRLTLKDVAGKSHVFEGALKDQVLTVDSENADSKETERLVFTFLHDNRFLYRFEKKPAGRPNFARVYQVGVTKKDAAFAAGPSGPECVVSGGKGTITVSYKGQTYYVCCSGCRDAFKDDPEKFIKEYNEKKAKK